MLKVVWSFVVQVSNVPKFSTDQSQNAFTKVNSTDVAENMNAVIEYDFSSNLFEKKLKVSGFQIEIK